MNPLILTYLLVVLCGAATVWSWMLVRSVRRWRKRRETLRQVQAELAFLDREYERMFRDANRAIECDNFRRYERCVAMIHNLDTRYEREVREKLKNV